MNRGYPKTNTALNAPAGGGLTLGDILDIGDLLDKPYNPPRPKGGRSSWGSYRWYKFNQDMGNYRYNEGKLLGRGNPFGVRGVPPVVPPIVGAAVRFGLANHPYVRGLSMAYTVYSALNSLPAMEITMLQKPQTGGTVFENDQWKWERDCNATRPTTKHGPGLAGSSCAQQAGIPPGVSFRDVATRVTHAGVGSRVASYADGIVENYGRPNQIWIRVAPGTSPAYPGETLPGRPGVYQFDDPIPENRPDPVNPPYRLIPYLRNLPPTIRQSGPRPKWRAGTVQRPQVDMVPPTSLPGKPTRGTSERKFKGAGNIGQMIGAIMEAATEASDLTGIFLDSIPGGSEVEGGLIAQWQFIMANLHNIRWDEFIVGLINNQVEDAVVGRVVGILDSYGIKVGFGSNISSGGFRPGGNFGGPKGS